MLETYKWLMLPLDNLNNTSWHRTNVFAASFRPE